MKFETKTSTKKFESSTGAHRGSAEGKGRFDLISPIAITRLAQLLERGADIYGERNWEKGLPLARYLDSAMRHLNQLLMGLEDEDHAAAVIFNVMAFMHTQHMIKIGSLPNQLDDMPEFSG